MSDAATAARIVRLQRIGKIARERLRRRVNRSSTIYWSHKNYYGIAPKISRRWTLYEEWDNRKRRWCYDDAVLLETEAAILVNMLEIMLLDVRQGRTTAYYTSRR